MRFDLDAQQRDFAASIDAALAAADVPGAVRAWAAGDTAPGRKVWAQLADLGVTALAVPEQFDGLDEGDMFDLLDEGVHVAAFAAAKAVEVAVVGSHVK